LNGKHLLDTDMVIGLLGVDADARRRMEEMEETFISSVVQGELHLGAYKSARPDEGWHGDEK